MTRQETSEGLRLSEINSHRDRVSFNNPMQAEYIKRQASANRQYLVQGSARIPTGMGGAQQEQEDEKVQSKKRHLIGNNRRKLEVRKQLQSAGHRL